MQCLKTPWARALGQVCVCRSPTIDGDMTAGTCTRVADCLVVSADMELEHIHSYSGSTSKQNLLHLHAGALLFNSGPICVVHDLKSDTQRFFRHHTEFVSAFALFPHQAGNLVASAQDGLNPRVCIWNTATMHLVSMLEGTHTEDSPLIPGALVFPLFLDTGVRSLSFARDGRQLVTLGDDVGCTIVVHECTSNSTEGRWTSSKFVASTRASDVTVEKALNVLFSPFSNTIVSSGVKHMKFWEVQSGGELMARSGVFGGENTGETHVCAAFLDAETCITGTETGMIWIWKGIRVMQVIAWAHNGPIFDLAVDGQMVLSSGQDMKLCFWNMQKDFRIVPPGKIDRGEMLVKQLLIADTVKKGNPGPNSRWLEDIGVGCVKALAWNSHRVFVGTGSNHIFVVDDVQHAAALLISGHHRGGMTGLCSHPRLPWMLSVGREGTILVRSMVTTKTLLARNLQIDRATRKLAQNAGEGVVKHKTRVVVPKKRSDKEKTKPGEVKDDEEEEEDESESENEEDVPEDKRKKKVDWPVQLTCIDVCQYGTHVAVGQHDGGFAVVSLEYDGQELVFDDLFAVVPKKPKDAVTCIKMSPSVACIAVGFSRGVVKIYQTANLWKKKAASVVAHGLSGKVTRIDWDDKSRIIRCNDSYNDLKIFDVRSGSEIDYFGALYSVKLKRLRFCPPDLRKSKDASVDLESHPEAKIIGLGVTRRNPYLVQCVSSLVDANGVASSEAGYSNELIQLGDRVIEVAGRAVEHLNFESLKSLFNGQPCKPECGANSTDCVHSIVEIVFAKKRSSMQGSGPGVGGRAYQQNEMNVDQCGPFHLEGKWSTSSCPLTWASHRLYLEKYSPGEVLSTCRSASHKMMGIGDTYGHLIIMGFPCDPARMGNQEGQKLYCPVDHMCFTAKDTYLLVGNEMHSALLQWKPHPVTKGQMQPLQKIIKTPARSPDGITNVHLRLVLDRPLASQSSKQGHVDEKRIGQDAFDANLQWWQNAVPAAEQQGENDGHVCGRELILDHAYGYNGREGRHNVFELMNGDLLFPVGCLCVLNRTVPPQSLVAENHSTQLFFRGHSEFVTTLAVHPNGRIVASGDCGYRPLICVWDIESSDWMNRSLSVGLATIRGFHRNGISALSFSSDGQHLVSAGEDDENSIAVFAWQRDAMMPFAVFPSGKNRVFCCAFNPYAFEFVTCGVQHVSFWAFEDNLRCQVEKAIAIQSVHDAAGKDMTDVLLQVLLTCTPADIAKTCPNRIVSRGSSLSDQFMEWAIHDEECCDSYSAAKALGKSHVSSTNICAAYIDRQTAVTGSADGSILVWENAQLISLVSGHKGPVFDVDCPKNRGNFRGDLMISNAKNEKHFVRVDVRGAATEDVMNGVAQEALEQWHTEFKRTNILKSNPPLVKHALIRWEASDPQEFITCGEDGHIKLWGMGQQLRIGESSFEMSVLFENHCTRLRGGHKFRSKTVTCQEFLACISQLHLLYETEYLHDGEHAYETTKSSQHIRLSRAEALRIFRDQNAPELHYGDFVTCVERIFNLLGVRAEAEHLQLVNLREDLEQDLADFEAAQSGAHADTFDYSILKTKEDIKKIDVQLRKGRISMRNVLRPVRTVQFERPDLHDGEVGVDRDCLRSIFLKDGMIFVGTSANSIFSFDMQTEKWSVRATGHEHGGISSISSYPTDSKMLVSGGQDNQLIVWNGTTRAVETRRRFPSPVVATDFSPVASELLVVGLHTGDIFILDLSKGSLSHGITQHYVQDSICVLRFSPNGQWVAVGYHSSKIRLFELHHENENEPSTFIEKRGGTQLIEHANVFHGHNGPVTAIDWSVDSSIIQSASRLAGELLYWTCHDGRPLKGLTMSDIKELKWSSSTCIFGWHMHGPHKHVSKHTKVINKDVEPCLGQRVKQAYGDSGNIGTIVRVARDKRVDVRWDTNVIEGTIGLGNTKYRQVSIGYGGTPKFDLVLAEQPCSIYGHEIASTDRSKQADKKNPAFVATGDSGGCIQLLSFTPPPFLVDKLVVFQQYAHPGGAEIVKFSIDNKVLYSTGRLDHCLLQWTCQPQKDLFFSVADILRQCASTGVREFFGGLSVLADNLFPENTIDSLRKRDLMKDILEEMKMGLTFGPKDVVGVTIALQDEGNSVPKSATEEAKKERGMKQDIAEAVGMLQSRIQYCGWERASADPKDPKYNCSHVHLNLLAAEFEGFGKISSAELFADAISEQARDPESKLKNLMTTRLAISAEKRKAFEMIPAPLPVVKKFSKSLRACDKHGCEGATLDVDDTRAKMKTSDIGFQASRTAGFDFRFRRLRAIIFDSIIRTGVTSMNALKMSAAPKPLYRPKKPDLTHLQLVTIFQMIDYGDRGWMSHADFMLGLRRNPELAGLLGLPTIDLQKVASRHIYDLRYGSTENDPAGVDEAKKMDLEEFVSFFGLQKRENRPPASIENSKWTVSSNVMKPPALCDSRLCANGPAPPKRRWNERVTSRSILPVMTREEALAIFKELGLGNKDSITQKDFVWLLRRSPHLEDKLGRKKIKAEELAAFFSNAFFPDVISLLVLLVLFRHFWRVCPPDTFLHAYQVHA